MTTIEVITFETYKEQYADKVGSVSFPDEFYDCSEYVNRVKLRKNIKHLLPKRKRIVAILVSVNNTPRYKNIINSLIPYKTPICVSQDQAGAYYKTYAGTNFSMWASDYPVGDAIVVIR